MWHNPFCYTVLLIFFSVTGHANGYFSMAYGKGGTRLSDATGGQNYRTQAGTGFFISGGLLLPISPTIPHRYELQIGIGYMFQDSSGEDNAVSWRRIPIEAIYFYRNTREQYRFGWGVTYNFENEISAKGTNVSADTSVDNALGWVVTAEKLISIGPAKENMIGLGLKYVMIDYDSSSFSRNVSGDCLYFTYSAVIGSQSFYTPKKNQRFDQF